MKGRIGAAGVAAMALVTLTACDTTSSGGTGSSLANMLLYGGSTVPPSISDTLDEAYCPSVDVIEGGAALRVGSGEAVRHQISIAQLARECRPQPDGSVVVKVGVEGRVLIGAGGGSGRFTAPVRFVIKDGDKVVAARSRTASVALPAGQTQGTFVVVEDGLIVPPAAARTYEIQVGLGGSGSERTARARRR